jgi:serine protease Do
MFRVRSRRKIMTGWIVATATTAALGLGGAATLGARHHDQSPGWGTDPLASAEQAVRVFGGGSQIGVSIRDFNDDEVKAGRVSNGVVIEDVEADGPAQKAGFKAGDVVTDYDGERVRSTRQFIRLVQETADGRAVAASVMRDGQRVPLTVQPRPGGSFKFWDGSEDRAFRLAPKVMPPAIFKEDQISPKFDVFVAGVAGPLGLLVDELTPQLGEYFGAREGVLVKTVRDNSNASRAGVKAGDVITSVNGGTVSSAVDLRRRAQRLEDGDEFTLAIVRDKKPMTLKGKVEAPARRSQTKTIV